MIINHFCQTNNTREPQWTDFITVGELFPPKNTNEIFPTVLEKRQWSHLKQGGCFLSNRKWAIVINSAGVSSMWLKWWGLYTENTQTRPKVTATLTTHSKDRNSVMETALWFFINHFPVAGGLFQNLEFRLFLLSFFHVNVADNKPIIELCWLIYFDKNYRNQQKVSRLLRTLGIDYCQHLWGLWNQI